MKRGNLKGIGLALLNRSLILYRTLESFFTASAIPAEHYPRDAVVVKE